MSTSDVTVLAIDGTDFCHPLRFVEHLSRLFVPEHTQTNSIPIE
jgi:hypothetical protein